MRPVKQAVYNSRTADKFVLRLPDDMREKIQEIARNHHRSMNSQMINWLTLCVELEDAGVQVTKDSLAVAASVLKEMSDKEVTNISYGEVVKIPESYMHGENCAIEPREFETADELVQVFALGRVADINTGSITNKPCVRVKWLHNDRESNWIPFGDIQRIQ
jgi:hypothetical protein